MSTSGSRIRRYGGRARGRLCIFDAILMFLPGISTSCAAIAAGTAGRRTRHHWLPWCSNRLTQQATLIPSSQRSALAFPPLPSWTASSSLLLRATRAPVTLRFECARDPLSRLLYSTLKTYISISVSLFGRGEVYLPASAAKSLRVRVLITFPSRFFLFFICVWVSFSKKVRKRWTLRIE